MTKVARTPLFATLALTLSFIADPGPIAAESRPLVAKGQSVASQEAIVGRSPVLPGALVADTPAPTKADGEIFCGNGDIIVIYDEDANGNRIPGTEVYGCTDD